MKNVLTSLTVAGILAMAGAPGVLANSISDVEEARANERSGRWLTDREIDALRAYGGNDDRVHSRIYVDRPYGGIYVGPTVQKYANPWIDRYLD